MSESSFEPWEARVQELAASFPYPPTPDIAGAVRQRLSAKPEQRLLRSARQQWVWLAVTILLVLAGLLAVPQVRAAVVEWLQLGAVRIFLVEPTPSPTPTPLPTTASATPTATPLPSPTPLASILDLAGETTLAEAQAQVDFPVRLPAGLGPPDLVFLQDLDEPAVILVWLDPANPRQVQLSLHQLSSGALVEKGQPVVIEETTVNGEQALWTTGPYILRSRSGDYSFRRLIDGHVLIWVENTITYRLETALSLEEARRIAESLP
jgi:hypothetical protein